MKPQILRIDASGSRTSYELARAILDKVEIEAGEVMKEGVLKDCVIAAFRNIFVRDLLLIRDAYSGKSELLEPRFMQMEEHVAQNDEMIKEKRIIQ